MIFTVSIRLGMVCISPDLSGWNRALHLSTSGRWINGTNFKHLLLGFDCDITACYVTSYFQTLLLFNHVAFCDFQSKLESFLLVEN